MLADIPRQLCCLAAFANGKVQECAVGLQTVVGWTELMDQALTAAAAECGATEPAVRAAARSLPMSPAVIQVPACFGPTQRMHIF